MLMRARTRAQATTLTTEVTQANGVDDCKDDNHGGDDDTSISRN